MRSIYKEKASGAEVEFDVQHADTTTVVFQREGRAREMLPRPKFDEQFELVSSDAPAAAAAPAAAPTAPRTTYRDKASGASVKIEIREMDMNHAVFVRPGRAPERVSREDFDKAYEVVLPAVSPNLIPSVPMLPQAGGRPDPNGPPVIGQQVPPPDVPDVIKAIRALGERFNRTEDALEEVLAKVTALYRKVTEAAPELTPDPAAPKDPTA